MGNMKCVDLHAAQTAMQMLGEAGSHASASGTGTLCPQSQTSQDHARVLNGGMTRADLSSHK